MRQVVIFIQLCFTGNLIVQNTEVTTRRMMSTLDYDETCAVSVRKYWPMLLICVI